MLRQLSWVKGMLVVIFQGHTYHNFQLERLEIFSIGSGRPLGTLHRWASHKVLWQHQPVGLVCLHRGKQIGHVCSDHVWGSFWGVVTDTNMRFVHCSQSPPYYAVALAFLDSFISAIPWVATLQYGYRIAPPDLVATMAACISTVEFIISKSGGVYDLLINDMIFFEWR